MTFVVISGCSGGGKSTLIDKLKERGFDTCPEAGREIVREQLATGGDALPWKNGIEFGKLVLSRSMHYYDTAPRTGKPVLFDRSIIDIITGFQRAGATLPEQFTDLPNRYRYARRVFMTPPWVEIFAQDAERRHSFDRAVVEYESLLEGYPANGYEVVLVPKGSIEARADFVESQLG